MNALDTNNFSLSSTQYIKNFCHSLQDKKIVNFVHDITFGHGEISMLVTEQKIRDFYYNNTIPIACSDYSGRKLRDGIYIDKVLEDYHPECIPLMALLRNIGQKKGLNYGTHAIHFSVREPDCQNLYTIFFDMHESDFLHYVVNNGSFFEDMIENYQLLSRDIILEAKSVNNRVVQPSFNDSFLPNNLMKTNAELKVCVFHRKTNLPTYLPKQQGRCLMHLTQGKSSKEIARAMNLSTRTIDFYLDILRKQLGCRSSKELIISYAEQLSRL